MGKEGFKRKEQQGTSCFEPRSYPLLHLSSTAPPGKCFEAWQRETRKEPTAPSTLAGYVSANFKMSCMSMKAALKGVKEVKYRRQTSQWPYTIHTFS